MGVLRLFRNPKLFSGSAAFSKMSTINKNNIVWVDLELTGLDIKIDHILEIACLVTDLNLNLVAEGPNIIIHQDTNVLKNMNAWCIEQHAKTGLTDACLKSTIDLKTAEKTILDFAKEYAPKGDCPLAGNTIYMDRIFLQKHMPDFESHLHYRNVDVSSIKELCRRWYPDIYKSMPPKQLHHRALSDIHESIAEMNFYRNNLFIKYDNMIK